MVQKFVTERNSFKLSMKDFHVTGIKKFIDENGVLQKSRKIFIRKEYRTHQAPGFRCADKTVLLPCRAAIKLPPAKPEVYCWGASKALVTLEPPKGGYSPNFIWS
ncbi:hypothetical protein [Undibacterium sp. Tian12W]|uniref:hypothetical protein n=1 Tax=Undibacterium sp. Tian12W TaxID=3413054 RepID=UPI003BF1E35F